MTTVQQYKESLQKVFKSDFCGSDIFIKEVLSPLFKEIEFLEEGDLLLRTEYAKYRSNGLRCANRVAQISDMFDVIDVYEITLDDKIDLAKSKVHIQSFVRSEAQVFAHAFMLFHYENVENCEWRFSYMYKEDTIKSATSAKRFTYLFGKNVSCRTAVERFSILFDKKIEKKDILDAFSVEALSTEFFKGYKAHYENFCQYLYANCTDTTKFGELFGRCGEKALRDYVKKMLGRLVFIQFLHRKRWAPNLLVAYNNHPELQDNFLDAYLEPLFGGILNTPKKHRLYEFRRNVKRGWDESLIKEFESVPYLNGGLFESDIQDPLRSRFPKEYFCNLFQFFEQYNFTIDENESDDAEIGIDPEMLGKIFENLLEDNKDKGAFYTPKEIVQYMCRESLVQYLENHIDKKYHSAVEKLIRRRTVDLSIQPKEIAQYIYSLLENVKICDPAIGSGVFPMGMLSELYNARLLMYGFTKPKKDFVHFDVKKSIIENNIYGVDIERGAIDIARLRFWLSLLIAEKEPVPLPNFDYKFMRGNSLIESFEGVDLSNIYNSMQTNQQVKIIFDDESLAEESFERNMKEYFNTNDSVQKTVIRQKIDNAVKALVKAKTNGNKALHTMLEGIACSDTDKFFLWHTWFSDVFENGGFDIVIGNPPYISAVTNARSSKEKAVFKTLYPEATGSYDMYVLFLLLGQKISTNVCSWIIPNKFLIQDYAKKTFEQITTNNLTFSVDVSTFKVFKTASVYPIIIQINKKTRGEFKDYQLTEYEDLNKGVFCEHKKILAVDTIKSLGLKVCSGATGFEAQKIKQFVRNGDGNNCIPFTVSGNVDRYLYNNTNVQYMKGKYANAFVFLDSSIPSSKIQMWNNAKIVIAGMTKCIEATFVDSPLGLGVGIYAITDFAKLSPLYILGLLNSKYTTWFLRNKFKAKHLAGGYLAINKSTIEELPMYPATLTQQEPIIALVEQILAAKQQDMLADTTELEDKIDLFVYKLYDLNYDEVLIIDPNTNLTREMYNLVKMEVCYDKNDNR